VDGAVARARSLLLLKERPLLIAELLRDALGIALSDHTEARVEETDFTQLVPTEYRADLAITLRLDGAPVMGIVVETQLAVDADKRFTWPLYVAALHAKLRCATALVVIPGDDGVATWAARPIVTLQPGFPLAPLVLDHARVPVIASLEDAQRAPELAVLSALAHGRGERAREVALAAVLAARDLDDAKRTLYTDLVIAALDPALRDSLELDMDLSEYEFKSEFFREKIARAEARAAARGAAEGEARAILTILAARGLSVGDDVRERITACTDLDQLDRWTRRALSAASAEDVVREP